ncbi:PIR protein CIR protein [Plasmodium vinckei lentum]|uniref:PIR protein CIR protein n=1 Tax=Plasmodium vinckei lentum TaxID=138297 RepID=A0A6V7RWC2_PLAVN|nr:PIR protein CIR protein [Plasmodium vinckei lentum]
MDKNVCNLFIKVDELFIKEKVKENEFNKSYTNFCDKGACSTNYDRIGALCEYLLTELPKLNNKSKGSKDNANQNYEFVFMWLADKFLKIAHDYSFSIGDYYEDVIVQSGSNFNCWDKLDSKKYLKGSNLSIMSKFYYVFMNICNALVMNDISKFDVKKFKKFDFEHYRNYKLINSEAYNCYAYIQMLTDLKKTYDEYRNLAIKQIPNDQQDSVKNLTCPEINNKDSHPELLFQSNGCIQLHAFFGQPRPKPKPNPPPDGSQNKKPQKDTNQSTKNESQPSNIGEELNFEKIRDYSVQVYDKYSPLFKHVATRIEHNIRDMVTHNFNDMVGISAKYLKAIEKVKFPKFQFQVPNNQQKESDKTKKEKVEPPTPSKTTEGTKLTSNGISSKVVDAPGNNLMGLNRNITRLMSFKFEGNKVAIIALTVVSITIVLAIMYWKKKMGNKIINLIDEKGRTNRVISPIDQKRAVKTNIDSDYGENTTIVIINPYDEKNITIQGIKPPSLKITLLNTYKHICVNPSPFINLFFLLIFFVYKKKRNSLE